VRAWVTTLFVGDRSQQSLIGLPQADSPRGPARQASSQCQLKSLPFPSRKSRTIAANDRPVFCFLPNVQGASLTGDRVAPGPLCHRSAYAIACDPVNCILHRIAPRKTPGLLLRESKPHILAVVESQCPITVQFYFAKPIALRQPLHRKRLHRFDERKAASSTCFH